MNNNDILRRIRYIFDFDDSKMVSVFNSANYKATRAEISDLLKKDDNPDFKKCDDKLMAIFLNGLIIDQRGKKDGPQPEPEEQLNNNIIFNKLKIASNLKAKDVLDVLDLTGFSISKHELSAFFRRPDHKNYRECKDQVLRNFLNGLQLKYRDKAEPKPWFEWESHS